MKTSPQFDRDEFDLIAAIRRGAGAHSLVRLGIGDDAAVMAATGSEWLVAADMLLEGTHFAIPTATAPLIGRKALAVNLSDIAAMAGSPVAAFVSVAHHRDYGRRFADELHAGIASLAREYAVAIAGGDTTVWNGPLAVNITLLGQVTGGRPVTRAGAQPGDKLFVTGPLGGSLPSGKHLSFRPRVTEALALHAAVNLHAMIDISDGLVADVCHLAEESGCNIQIFADAVPIASDVVANDLSRLTHALTDGEDFELAFCVSSEDAARLRTASPVGVTLFEVGEVVDRSKSPTVEVLAADGEVVDLPTRGWVHRWLVE